MMKKAELVFIPTPGMGHLVSTVEMAKLLINRDDRLSVTVLIMTFPFESNISSYTQSLSTTKAAADPLQPERIRFVYLAQDESKADLFSSSPRTFFRDFVDWHKTHVRQVVSEMISNNNNYVLTGFVVDMFCTPMIDVANEFGVPTFVFLTSSAAFLGLIFHIQTLLDHHNQDITELNIDDDHELSVPAFVNPLPIKVLPDVVLDKEVGSPMFLSMARRFRETKGIIVNTFTEFESHAVNSLSNDDKIPPIYPVGPVINLTTQTQSASDDTSKMMMMTWLDNQPPCSVVFVCFGSKGSFDADQVREIADALERSGHRFLWSLRRPPTKGKLELPGEYDDPRQVLPEGFLERTAEMGKVIGWAPQVAVLSHPAVGGFVSHCGWNSTLESLWCGVPVATWPLSAEQQMNAFQMVRELGLAVEIKLDYRKEFGIENQTESTIVTAEEIESGIRKLMDVVDDDQYKIIKKRVKEMSKMSRIAVAQGGSSYNALGRLIQDLISDVM